jgi:hypothetical protein
VTIKTYNFTYDLIENYYLRNLLESEYWLFGSRSTRTEITPSRNTFGETVDVLGKTVFGSKFSTLDYSFMVRSIFWVQGTTYSKYDSNEELAGKNFYVIVEPESETGPYDVFKCISNNYDGPSEIKPQSNESINQTGGVYRFPDGYVWKYMTSIPFAIYRKFAARGYAPIPRNAQVEQIASDGIDFIEVLNPDSNAGYQFLEGTVNSKTQNSVYLLDIQGSFFEAINVYRDTVLYAETQEGGVEVYPIIGSRRVGQRLEVTIQGDVFADFNPTDLISIQVIPQVRITGNGTGAKAIPLFNSQRTRISSIRILTSGSGYTQASATIVTPAYFAQLDVLTTSIASLRPVISPIGGHGANVIRELRANAIGLSAAISSIGTDIVDNGKYTTLALVKNPEFDEEFSGASFDNRLKIELLGTDPTALMVVGDIVTQTRLGETVTGVIHEIESENSIYLVDYDGNSSIEFDSSSQISVRNNIYNIAQINRSSYEAGSGEVLYITDFLPVERTEDKTEQIKVILEF